MKKNPVTIAISVAISLLFVQTNAQQSINVDTSFGTNGIVAIPLTAEADDLQIVESSDNKLFVFGKDIPSSISVHPNKIHKLNLNGSFDTAFGTGGTLTLPDYISDFAIVPQGSDKILVTFQKTTLNPSPKISVLRYDLITGQTDPTFGIAGEFSTDFDGINGFRYNNVSVLSDNSIIISTGTKFIKLLPNGTIDSSYGNNGTITQNNSGYILESNSEVLNFYDDKITKTTLNGDTNNNFGINGTFTYPATSYYFSRQNSDGSINSLDFDNNLIYHISSNGTLINTLPLSHDNNSIEYYSNFFSIGNHIYFTGGTYSDNPFIICYDQSGNLVQLNNQNSYKDIAFNGAYSSLIVKSNMLYAAGYKYNNGAHHYTVTKYNITNSTLSAEEVKTEKATFNIYPNPVKGNTIYFNRATGYELYDMSSKLLRKEKSALTIDTSKLNTGVYLIKTSEGEVKRVIVK